MPKERSGVAWGISGTVRFTGLVVGIAALGAVLYSRVTLAVAEALPKVPSADRATLVHDITAGKPSVAALARSAPLSFMGLPPVRFLLGFYALFFGFPRFLAGVPNLALWSVWPALPP